MNYTHKSLLRTLINEYNATKNNELDIPELFELYTTNKDMSEAFDILKDKSYIDFKKDINGNLYDVVLNSKGITYFSDARKEQLRYWLPVSISIIAIIVSVLSLIIDLITLF